MPIRELRALRVGAVGGPGEFRTLNFITRQFGNLVRSRRSGILMLFPAALPESSGPVCFRSAI